MSADRLGREVVLEEGVRVVMPEHSDRVLGALERGFQLAHDLDIWQVQDVVDEGDFARVGCPRIRALHPVIRHVNGQLAPLRFIRCASVYQYTVSLLLVILLLGCLVWRDHRGHGLGRLALLHILCRHVQRMVSLRQCLMCVKHGAIFDDVVDHCCDFCLI